MTTQEQHRSEKEGQQQAGDRSNDGINGQAKQPESKEDTPHEESEGREQIAKMRREMAQSQTGFTGD